MAVNHGVGGSSPPQDVFNFKMKSKRVVVAMSGGDDSSVAALLMKKKGYEVIGVFMKNYSSNAGGTKNGLGECDWIRERSHAMKIAEILKIPLITFDFEREYRRDVVEKMFKDYRSGKTPNPDIDCNEKVKFPMLLKVAKRLGADFVVTGHYARIKKVRTNKDNKKIQVSAVKNNKISASESEQQYKLLRAMDESKDQSYFLYRMKQTELSKTLFPIGNYTKKQIREIAKKNGFPNHDKKSTVGICFIGKVNLKEFLKKRINPKKGKILSPEGKIVGEHDGVYYYTIGQRIGPRYGIEISKPFSNADGTKKQLKRWYIAVKNAKRNEIVAAPQNHELLYRKKFFLKNPYWINEKPRNNEKILARIRQVGELLTCRISHKEGRYKIILKKPITGVSQGQACVLYYGKEVLGGGEINFV